MYGISLNQWLPFRLLFPPILALHLAASCGFHEVVMALAELDADVTKVDAEGMTPLQRAEEEGHLIVVRYLRKMVRRVACDGGSQTTLLRL